MEENQVPQEIRSENEHVPSGDQPTPSGDERESSDSSEILKETTESPSGEKEANMPLDEESKESVRETVKGEVGPLKENWKLWTRYSRQ